MRFLIRVFDSIHSLLVLIGKVLLSAMIVVIFANVTLRYVFNSGIRWSEEIARVFVVWFTFIAMAIGVRYRLHINLNVLPRTLPAWVDKLLFRFGRLLIMGLGAVMLYYGWILVGFTSRSILPATGLPAAAMYVIVPIVAVVIIFDALLDFLGMNRHVEESAERTDSHAEEERGGDEDA